MNLPENKTKQNKQIPTALVAGGAGFIGFNLTAALLKTGWRVILIDNFSTSKESSLVTLINQPNLKVINHDLTKSDFPKMEKINQVWHLVSHEAYLYQNSKTTLHGLLTNSFATKNLLDIAISNKATFLLASSIEVYRGLLSSQNLNYYFGATQEDTIRFSHAESKRYAEALTWEYFKEKELDARICRLGEVYGPKMNLEATGHLGLFIKQLKKSGNLTVEGDGLEKEYYVHIDDLIDGLLQSMNRPNTCGKIVPLIPTEPVTTLELAYIIKNSLEEEPEILFKENPEKAQLPNINPNEYLNLKSIKWSHRIPLKTGVSQLLAEHNFKLSPNGQKQIRDTYQEIAPEITKKKEVVLPEPPPLEKEVEEVPEKKQEKALNKALTSKIVLKPRHFLFLLIAGAIIFGGMFAPTFITQKRLSTAVENINKSVTYLEDLNIQKAALFNNKSQISTEKLAQDFTKKPLWWWNRDLLYKKQDDMRVILTIQKIQKELLAEAENFTAIFKNLFSKRQTPIEKKLGQADSLKRNIEILSNLKKQGIYDQEVILLTEKISAYEKIATLAQEWYTNQEVLLGYNKPVVYILVIRDSNQPSSSGGVPITISLVRVSRGIITEIEVDDFKSFFEDAVWEGDFPSWYQAENLIQKVSDKEDVVGVVSITTNTIPQLMRNESDIYLGQINKTVNKENVLDTILNRTEQNSQNKDIITQIMQQLLQQLFQMTELEQKNIIVNFGEMLQKKEASVFIPKLKKSLQSLGWSEYYNKQRETDTLGFFDNSLEGNRAGSLIKREQLYQIRQVYQNEKQITQSFVTIKYQHTGIDNAWPTGKFSNQWQLAIPKGSKITEVRQENQLLENYKTEELVGENLLLVSGNITVGAGEKKELYISYQLPEDISLKNYNLQLMPQWGQANTEWVVTIQQSRQVENYDIDFSQGKIQTGGSNITWETVTAGEAILKVAEKT